MGRIRAGIDAFVCFRWSLYILCSLHLSPGTIWPADVMREIKMDVVAATAIANTSMPSPSPPPIHNFLAKTMHTMVSCLQFEFDIALCSSSSSSTQQAAVPLRPKYKYQYQNYMPLRVPHRKPLNKISFSYVRLNFLPLLFFFFLLVFRIVVALVAASSVQHFCVQSGDVPGVCWCGFAKQRLQKIKRNQKQQQKKLIFKLN